MTTSQLDGRLLNISCAMISEPVTVDWWFWSQAFAELKDWRTIAISTSSRLRQPLQYDHVVIKRLLTEYPLRNAFRNSNSCANNSCVTTIGNSGCRPSPSWWLDNNCSIYKSETIIIVVSASCCWDSVNLISPSTIVSWEWLKGLSTVGQ